MSDMNQDLDPQEVIEQADYVAPDEDPTGEEITDPSHPDYVEPATDVVRPGGLIAPEVSE